MATIVNERDKLLQAASPRDTDPARGKSLILACNTPVFHVSNVGQAAPASIQITANAINLPGAILWEVESGASALAVAGDTRSATLFYSSMTADSATIRARTTYLGITYEAACIVARVVDGANGSAGLSTGHAYAYKRSAAVPADNPGDVTFSFTVNAITVPSGNMLANGWTKTIPAGNDPLYVTVATATGAAATDSIGASEWPAPALFSRNGLNTATVYLYQRAAGVPALPSADLDYTFATGALQGMLGGWSRFVPSGSNPLYVTTATALSSAPADTIGAGEWALPTVMAQNGSNGVPGSAGARGTVDIVAEVSGNSWSNTAANAAVAAAGYGTPVDRDRVTLYNDNMAYSETRYRDGTAWLPMDAFVNGNLLVAGTLSADKITVGTLRGINISGVNISGSAINVDNRFVVTTNGMVTATELFGYSLTYRSNAVSPAAIPGTFRVEYPAAAQVALHASSQSSLSSSHAIRGNNTNAVSSGLVGAANGKAFHAESGTAGPFTGSHDVALPNGLAIEPGDIVLDTRCLLRGGWSNTFFEAARSTRALQRAAIGVYTRDLGPLADYGHMLPMLSGEQADGGALRQEFTAICHAYRVGEVNALGEGQMNVCGEGGDIEAGDFIVTSSIPGKGMRLDPGLALNLGLLGAIVARAREPASFAAANDIQSIACIYICG